jgi:hypothetical protein
MFETVGSRQGRGRRALSRIAAALPTVDSYGADPSGVVDSSAAFARMLGALGYVNCSPNGTYTIKNIVIGTNQQFLGNGARLLPAAGASWMVRLTGFRPRLESCRMDDNTLIVTNQTTLSSAASAAATTLVVTTAAGMAIGQWIAVRQDNNDYFGAFITGIAGTTITMSAAIIAPSSAGSPVVSSWGMISIQDATYYDIDDIFFVNASIGIVTTKLSTGSAFGHINKLQFTGARYAGIVEGKDLSAQCMAEVGGELGFTDTNTYAGTGAQTVFFTGNPIHLKRDITVTVNGVAKVQTTDYSVTGRFQITFVSAPANGATVVINNFTDAWFGLFSDQTGSTSNGGGNDYLNTSFLDCYWSRWLAGNVFDRFFASVSDTCERGERIYGCTNLVYNGAFIGFCDQCLYIDGNSEVLFGGTNYILRVPTSYTVSGSVGNAVTVTSGSKLRWDTAGTSANSEFQRSGSGDFVFSGSHDLYLCSTTQPAAGSSNYLTPSGTNANANAAVMQSDGTILGFSAQTTAAPGAAKNFTYTVMVNGAPSSITGQISGAGGFSVTVASAGVAFAVGSSVCLRIVTDAGAAVTDHRTSIQIV